MTRMSSNADDKQQNNIATKVEEFMSNVTVTTCPVIITGVQRKANVGNYETIDIYCAIALPQPDLDVTDKEALTAAVQEAAELGFYLTSKETGDRYNYIKKEGKK